MAAHNFSLKDRVNLLRESGRVSCGELARVAGISLSTVRGIVDGKAVHVTGQTILAIAEAVGCTTDWLLGRPVPGPTPMAIRHAIRSRGGRVRERAGEPDPLNEHGARSRRGFAKPRRSSVIEADPGLPPAPTDDEEQA